MQDHGGFVLGGLVAAGSVDRVHMLSEHVNAVPAGVLCLFDSRWDHCIVRVWSIQRLSDSVLDFPFERLAVRQADMIGEHLSE